MKATLEETMSLDARLYLCDICAHSARGLDRNLAHQSINELVHFKLEFRAQSRHGLIGAG